MAGAIRDPRLARRELRWRRTGRANASDWEGGRDGDSPFAVQIRDPRTETNSLCDTRRRENLDDRDDDVAEEKEPVAPRRHHRRAARRAVRRDRGNGSAHLCVDDCRGVMMMVYCDVM